MKKIYRVTLEYSVDIDETSIPQSGDAEEREYNDRQERLLQSILSDKERLSRYLWYEVASQAASQNYGYWYELFLDKKFLRSSGDADIEAILKPAITTLSTEDQTWFKEAEEEGIFFENIEGMQRCFSVSLEKVALEEQEVQG